jgi:hypothetical protein
LGCFPLLWTQRANRYVPSPISFAAITVNATQPLRSPSVSPWPQVTIPSNLGATATPAAGLPAPFARDLFFRPIPIVRDPPGRPRPSPRNSAHSRLSSAVRVAGELDDEQQVEVAPGRLRAHVWSVVARLTSCAARCSSCGWPSNLCVLSSRSAALKLAAQPFTTHNWASVQLVFFSFFLSIRLYDWLSDAYSRLTHVCSILDCSFERGVCL